MYTQKPWSRSTSNSCVSITKTRQIPKETTYQSTFLGYGCKNSQQNISKPKEQCIKRIIRHDLIALSQESKIGLISNNYCNLIKRI